MSAAVRSIVFRLLACLCIAMVSFAAGTARAQSPDDPVLFGPKVYQRLATTTVSWQTGSFSIPANAVAPFTLRIANGNSNGSGRVTQAWVVLNNVQVLTPTDFASAPDVLERTVTLRPGTNNIAVRVGGQLSQRFTLSVTGRLTKPQPTTVTPNPLSIVQGANGSLTVNLAPNPTAAGSIALQSSDVTVAAVPASAAFAAGQTAVIIPVTAKAVGSTTVTATLNGGSASATVNVQPQPPVVVSLLPATVNLTQGAIGQATVTIAPIQSTPTVVALISSAPSVASVPATVTIPAGAASANVSISALSVGAARIEARLNQSVAATDVTVTAVATSLVSMLPASNSIAVGGSTVLSVTLSAARSTPTVVPLQASPAGLVGIPSSVTIPASVLSANFTVSGLASGAATVSASLNGSTVQAAVQVTPAQPQVVSLLPADQQIASGGTGKLTVTLNTTQTTNTPVNISLDKSGIVTAPSSVIVGAGTTSVQFDVSAVAAGQVVVTATVGASSATALVRVAPPPPKVLSLVPNPLPVQVGASGSMTVNLDASVATSTQVPLSVAPAGIASIPASVTVPAGQTSASFQVAGVTPGTAQVTASLNGTSKLATVSVTSPPPTVKNFDISQLALPKGRSGTLKIFLTSAPAANTSVTLVSAPAGVAGVPASVLVPAGALSADIPVQALALGTATVTASLGGGSTSTSVVVGAPVLDNIVISPAVFNLFVTQTRQLDVVGTLSDGTQTSVSQGIDWASSNTNALSVSSSGVVTGEAPGTASVTATIGALKATANVTVLAVPALSLTPESAFLETGKTLTFTLSSAELAGPNGLVVSLTQSGTGTVTVPPSVTIPAAGSSASFPVVGGAKGVVVLGASAPLRVADSSTITVTLSAPVVSSIAPTQGLTGSTVTINGSGFASGVGGNQVKFGGADAVIQSATSTQIVATVPVNASTGPVTVTTENGTGTGPTFTVQSETQFSLFASPGNLALIRGVNLAISLSLVNSGVQPFTGLASLSIAGLPAGMTATFEAAALTGGQVSTVTLLAAASAPAGTYDLTITADAGSGLTRTALVRITLAPVQIVTGVKGRFVTPQGIGIAGVIVGQQDPSGQIVTQTTTDAAGNFVLTGLPSGAVTLKFDATPANPLYPIWPYTYTQAANQIINIPDWTINPPPTDDKFKQIANTATEQIVTDNRFPGLEIRLPAGVTITGWDGVKKTRIAVEKIDLTKLPVTPPPAPTGATYQLYFGTPMGGIPSQPIPVTLPNDVGAEPGETIDIWYFDGSPMGGTGQWKIAGQATISEDGKTARMPDGTGIPRFCGVCGLLTCGKQTEDYPTNPGKQCPVRGNPVNLFSGQESPSKSGLSCGGLNPISMGMSYNPVDAFNEQAGTAGSVGLGWILDYDVVFLPFPGSQKRIILPPNQRINFTLQDDGSYKSSDDPRFDGATLKEVSGTVNLWELTFRDRRVWKFAPFAGITGVIKGGLPLFLTDVVDRAGNVQHIQRQSNGRITRIGTNSRYVEMIYGANGFVSEMQDSAGQKMSFTYSADKRLASVTDADGKATQYTYVGDDESQWPSVCGKPRLYGKRVKTITYPGRPNPTTNHYGSSRRVLRQVVFDGLEHRFAYKLTGACVTNITSPNTKCDGPSCPSVDSWENYQAGWRMYGGQVIGTTYTAPDGNATIYEFSAAGTVTKITNALGQVWTAAYDTSNRRTQTSDPLGRVQKFTYDPAGNLNSIIDAANRQFSIGYDTKWNLPDSLTFPGVQGPLSEKATYHPQLGTITTFTNALGHTTSIEYTSKGQMKALTAPTNRQWNIVHNEDGDVVSVIDPLSNTTGITTDGIGRTAVVSDPLGFSTEFVYNGVGQTTQVRNAVGTAVNLTYDSAQRLATVRNELGSLIEIYEYDSGDRLVTRIDGAGAKSAYQYDVFGRLSSVTDRKGLKTTYGYDSLTRLISIGHPDSPQTFTYDTVGRLLRTQDPAGSVEWTYDLLNRVTREVQSSAQGKYVVDYQYDAQDRLIRRTVNGLDPTDYVYDTANRVTTIKFRNTATHYTWDSDGRMLSRTLPNGVKQDHSYDAAGRLASIKFRRSDATLIDEISYTYDAANRRTARSYANLPLSKPETPMAASYDSAGRIASLTFTATGQTCTFSHDANGNLASKNCGGAFTAYTWDSRNRLTGVSGPGLDAAYVYDALSRRLSRTINGVKTTYVYDGAQAIAETKAGVPAALLTGLAVDEAIAQFSTSNALHFLTDALGSVILELGTDGVERTSRAYSPYGEASMQGVNSENSSTYTAREQDGPLYFYRARYYDPQLKRFISSDPIGISGGLNTYSYAASSPTSLRDPFGLDVESWDGSGDLSMCKYYDDMAEKNPKCTYYPEAAKICRGDKWIVNRLVNMGMGSADMCIFKQSGFLERLRSDLIAEDKLAREHGLIDEKGCVRGTVIDSYHKRVFEQNGIGREYYGGTWCPAGCPFSPVPRDYFSGGATTGPSPAEFIRGGGGGGGSWNWNPKLPGAATWPLQPVY